MRPRTPEGFFDPETTKRAVEAWRQLDTGTAILWASYINLFPNHRLAQLQTAKILMLSVKIRSYARKDRTVIFQRHVPVEKGQFEIKTYSLDHSEPAEFQSLSKTLDAFCRLPLSRQSEYLDRMVPYDTASGGKKS